MGTKVTYKVTELSRTATDAEAKKINWQVKAGDHIHRDEKNVGLTYVLDVPGTHAGDVLSVHPYMNKPSNEIKVETKIGPFLKFDGSTLALYDKEHKKLAEWLGVSGEGDETNPKQPKGPIPEGRWMVRQSEIQKLPGMFSGEPNWEGGEAAWGKERVQIYAYGTQTHGRARFYIHGGKKAGSKFGIDLTDKIDEFLGELRKLGKDVVMVVKLEKKGSKGKGGLVFPLPFRPQESYKDGSRCFGANRSNGKRKHAGCDLYAPEGTPIYSIADGTVIQGPYEFYKGTIALEIDHRDFIARYTELKNETIENIRVGAKIKSAQLIGHVGKMPGVKETMLHFEIYKGETTGLLTDRNNPPYLRRKDLLDPTGYLDSMILRKEIGE